MSVVGYVGIIGCVSVVGCVGVGPLHTPPINAICSRPIIKARSYDFILI